jgi:hypothetical protein
MKRLSVLCVVFCMSFTITAAFARGGGMGTHHSSAMTGIPVTGGASGERPNSPGTNSLGTALSTSGFGTSSAKGPLLGASPTVDREEAKVEKALSSVCRGC